MTPPRPFPSPSLPSEPEAIQAFLSQHEEALRRFARRHLGRPLRRGHDTHDLFQSVVTDLFGLLRSGRRLPDGPRLVGFVRVMLRRKIAHYWRNEKKLSVLPLSVGPDARDRDIADPTAVCPAVAAEQKDAVQHLLAQIDRPTDHQIVIMNSERFTAPEIANAVGMSSVAVRVRLMRLRQKLQVVSAPVMD
ncbi:sigma-70 family RNA polymerase sigma factor [Fimbriiglobus ruber]|uniref:sigma-70 family RNA polymerase sigma factor n=1 Tax=Fimbriiglobus ruber TaxID=1908690 RepID=UPI000B4AD64F|nr:sigma-70 family RNA polymerase sigma factor [Fimbriiglobus ruber]